MIRNWIQGTRIGCLNIRNNIRTRKNSWGKKTQQLNNKIIDGPLKTENRGENHQRKHKKAFPRTEGYKSPEWKGHSLPWNFRIRLKIKTKTFQRKWQVTYKEMGLGMDSS